MRRITLSALGLCNIVAFLLFLIAPAKSTEYKYYCTCKSTVAPEEKYICDDRTADLNASPSRDEQDKLCEPRQSGVACVFGGEGDCKTANNPSKPGTPRDASLTVPNLQEQARSGLNKTQLSGKDAVAKFMGRAIFFLTGLIGSFALVLYIWAGVLWMTASGNSEKLSKAKTIIVWNTLAVVGILASYMLINFVFFELFGLKR